MSQEDLGLRPARDTELFGDLRVWVKLDVPGADVSYIPGRMSGKSGLRITQDGSGRCPVLVDRPYLEPLDKAQSRQSRWSRIEEWATFPLKDIFVRREEEDTNPLRLKPLPEDLCPSLGDRYWVSLPEYDPDTLVEIRGIKPPVIQEEGQGFVHRYRVALLDDRIEIFVTLEDLRIREGDVGNATPPNASKFCSQLPGWRPLGYPSIVPLGANVSPVVLYEPLVPLGDITYPRKKLTGVVTHVGEDSTLWVTYKTGEDKRGQPVINTYPYPVRNWSLLFIKAS